MSPDATSTSAPAVSQQPEPPPSWPALSLIERRILGVLIEKQKTSKTADSYPLTLNALVTGCNQKSNREPVLDLDEVEVEEGLTALQKKGLVERVTGGRAERFKHKLYEAWTKNGPELAVLAELLLRGPQTKGDLRGRAGRMDSIETLDVLDTILKPLVARRLVVFLGDPERRGALVIAWVPRAGRTCPLEVTHTDRYRTGANAGGVARCGRGVGVETRGCCRGDRLPHGTNSRVGNRSSRTA